MKPINEEMRKITGDLSKVSSMTASDTENPVNKPYLIGDPNCPICGGLGYIRKDVDITDPEFGHMTICDCRKEIVEQAANQRLIELSNLSSFNHMTFESFNPRGHVGLGEEQVNSLSYAYNQSMHFALELKGWLLLTGGFGCGKTHLAAAIANHVVKNGIPTLFLTVPDLLDWLRFSYSGDAASFESRFEEIRTMPVLVLDDLGTQNATPWAQEKLFQILNSRYVNRLATVITTNQVVEEIDGRIQSRLLDPELVTTVKIIAPDYRSPLVDSTQPQVSALSIYSKRTFGSFTFRERESLQTDEVDSLKRAFKACQEYAENPHGWLLLMGGYASGKTHLAAAIANYRLNTGDSPMFVVVPDLLDHLRATFNPNSAIPYDKLFNQVRSARLLILDDLGTQSATPWAMEKLYQIINHRYEAELPTVITTSSELKDIHPRIRSRMMDKRLCRLIILIAPPFEGMGDTSVSKNRKKR